MRAVSAEDGKMKLAKAAARSGDTVVLRLIERE
jgi:hypothetical protein